MGDLDDSHQTNRLLLVVIGVVCLALCVIGSILASGGEVYYSISACFCVAAGVTAVYFRFDVLYSVSLGLLLAVSGLIVDAAKKANNNGTNDTGGYALMLIGMWLWWLSINPVRVFYVLPRLRGMLMIIPGLWLLNFLGCILMWTDDTVVVISITAFIVSFIFFASQAFGTSGPATWILVFFGSFFQKQLLDLAITNTCTGTCQVGGVISWVALILMLLFVFFRLTGPVSTENRFAKKGLITLILVALCFVGTIVGTAVVDKDAKQKGSGRTVGVDEATWSNINAVLSVAALLGSLFLSGMRRVLVVLVSVGLLFASSGSVVAGADSANRANLSTQVWGYILVIVALWLAFAAVPAWEKYSRYLGSCCYFFTPEGAFTMFTLAFSILGLILFWIWVDANFGAQLDLTIIAALDLAWMVAIVGLRYGDAIYPGVFWFTYVQVVLFAGYRKTQARTSQNKGTGEAGSLITWIGHLCLLVILAGILWFNSGGNKGDSGGGASSSSRADLRYEREQPVAQSASPRSAPAARSPPPVATGARSPPPAPVSPSAGAAAQGARFCKSCGGARVGAGLYCNSCGAKF